MTPKEKAEEILDKLCWLMGYGNLEKEVLDVAIFNVDEILKLQLNDGYDHDYWQEVKQEIEKL